MEYYKILGLKKEPFSNSPEPEFFYLSDQHQRCLLELELAVRLKRGLNVVMGEVGTGKTTLCRQLILKLESFNENGKVFEVQLLLDPDIKSPLELLKTVARGFGISFEEDKTTEGQLKEEIKKYLYRKAVEEDRILVLIIDEGQKMPFFAPEKLREFLNYETNEHKLLQIVIFAQRELLSILEAHPNFADRVNQFFYLGPLSLKETRNLIESRLKKAADGTIPELFSKRAYREIWRHTAGYPRRIISLCHQIILALIVQSRGQATASLVRACARRTTMERPRRPFPIVATAVLALGIIFAVTSYYSMGDRNLLGEVSARIGGYFSTPPEIPAAPRGETAPPLAVEPGREEAQRKTEEKTLPAPPERGGRDRQLPSSLGVMTIDRDETVSHVLYFVYGTLSNKLLNEVARANPGLADLNLVRTGGRINLPAVPFAVAPPEEKPYLVEVAAAAGLAEAKRLIKDQRLPPARLLPYFDNRRGLVYAVILKETFYDDLTAKKVLETLPSPFSSTGRIIGKWDKDTIFFGVF